MSDTEQKPVFFCAVRGSASLGHMCLKVGAGSDELGRKRCHSDKQCQHKQSDSESRAPTGATHD